jgi:hypothetical protein
LEVPAGFSFLNQAFWIYSLPYPNPEPSGGSREKEFPKGADMKAPRGLMCLLGGLFFGIQNIFLN